MRSTDVCGMCLEWAEVVWYDVHIETEKGCFHAVTSACTPCWGECGPVEILSVTMVANS